MILPALTEAKSPYFRPIKYSLFPPLGLATLAGHLDPDDEAEIVDEHVEDLTLDDQPDLVVIEVYITSAYRAYEIARHYRAKGCYVAMGGLHVTSMPDEASRFADSIFLGPGEDTWPQFLNDFRNNTPQKVYRSKHRTLEGMPKIRRDLIKRENYLVPNSIIVSRGCPYNCDFCYKEPFFKGGRSFYTQKTDTVLEEITELKGRHLYFLDDHLFGNSRFAETLFEGMTGMDRLWQAAGTVEAVMKPGLMEKAVRSGLRSLFIGFETLNQRNLSDQGKHHNLKNSYEAAIKRLHDMGVMVNASFMFGLDRDDVSVFSRTVEWAVNQGIETATFHILTPYPGTKLHERLRKSGRILHTNWDRYDTRHAVFNPNRMSVAQLEQGYWQAYADFYSWKSIIKSASAKITLREKFRHLAYTGGWKKLEGLWGKIIQLNRIYQMRPLLEAILSGSGTFTVKHKGKKDQPLLENRYL
jgi:radical SAM superfamily enzyme YgiQ (UPF0313 family)